MSKAPKKLANIFIAEDNPGDIILINALMQEAKVRFEMHSMCDGEQVISFLEDLAKSTVSGIAPDIIFLDINIPKVNGMEILLYIQSHRRLRDIPVCMLSGSESNADIKQCMALGAIDYLIKPLNYEKLQKIAAKVLHVTFVQDDDGISLLRVAS